ncbi:amino acid permease [Candidatus Woesearchaeota archaeon]|nr:MAG: amino acid permease [Candidatus Woesearchaeota archaeon]
MQELRRSAGFWTIVALTLTSLIGSGTFFGISLAANQAGIFSLVSWLILGLISIYVAACFGELIAMFPKAGGVYEFSKEAYGITTSYIMGWVAWMVSNVTAAILIVSSIDYILPAQLKQHLIPISVAVILFFNAITYFGIEASGVVLGIFAFIGVGAIILFTVLGFLQFDPQRIIPSTSPGLLAIFAALFFILESLMGWESAGYLAEETKNPERVIPKALMIATFLSTLMAVGLAAAILGAAPLDTIVHSPRIVEIVATNYLGNSYSFIIQISIFLALIGSALGGIVAAPRLLMALARDKLFFESFAKLHPRFNTPHLAVILQTIFTILVVIFTAGIYKSMLSILVIMALIMYVLVIIIIPLLRHKQPNRDRPFKVWFGKTGPWLISLLYLGTVISWTIREPEALSLLKVTASLLGIGIPIFLFLSFHYNPDFIRKFTDAAAPLNYLLENIFFPKRLRETIVSFENLEGKTILEYGAGVGTLTLHLAHKVGPTGRIIATDHSEASLNILRRRLNKHGFHNIHTMHDPHHTTRVHPGVPKVDFIFSVGMLSYMQNPLKILKEMHSIIPDLGRVCFVEYVNLFGIFPDPQWLSNEERLKELFKEAGFSIRIIRKNGWFWNYLIIYAMKTGHNVPFI